MEKLKTATLKDVAKLAGISAATVSRHLSGQLPLPADTTKRIGDAIKALGYQPNAMARRLSKGSSEMLGFATTDIAYPFFAEIASAAEAEADRFGYGLVIFSTRNDVAKELKVLSKIKDQQVDGVLLLTNHVDDGTLRSAVAESGRVVLLDEDIEGADAPRIFAENVIGAGLATDHLIEQGHTKIAFIGGTKGLLSSRERFGGFSRSMASAKLEVPSEFVKFGTYESTYGGVAFAELWGLQERPTAVVVGTDLLAMGVIRAATEAGVSIPSDLSIVGFDDLEVASIFAPPLTTVRQSPVEFGKRGVRALVDLIKGGSVDEIPQRIPVELMIRKSVAPMR